MKTEIKEIIGGLFALLFFGSIILIFLYIGVDMWHTGREQNAHLKYIAARKYYGEGHPTTDSLLREWRQIDSAYYLGK